MNTLEATVTGWKKVYDRNVCPGIVCEYKNCKQEADYWIAENQTENENGRYKYRCKEHLYK